MRNRSALSLDGEYAGFLSRLVALILDVILANTVILFVGIGTNWMLSFFTIGGYFSDGERLTDTGQMVLVVVVGLTAFAMNVVYYIAAWMLAGRTIGKGIMGLRIVQVEGKAISFRVALFRFIGYYISAAVLFLGFIWVLFDDERRGWHDKLTGTCVIYDRESTDPALPLRNRREHMPASRA